MTVIDRQGLNSITFRQYKKGGYRDKDRDENKRYVEYDFEKQGHINVQELRAHNTLVRSVARRRSSVRHVSLLDSSVVRGCLIKGRSSSSALNYELSKILPYTLGADLYGLRFPVHIHDSTADDPSRHHRVRQPAHDPLGYMRSTLAASADGTSVSTLTLGLHPSVHGFACCC